MEKLYYTPPSNELFDELKNAAIDVWSSYGEPYRSEKIASIKDIENVSDNFMYMVAMFDTSNQIKLKKLLSDDCKKAVSERLISGGCPDEYNFFKI